MLRQNETPDAPWPCELRVDLRINNKVRFAHYENFAIGDEHDNFRLSLNSYSGTAGDGFRSGHDGISFSTPDRDNDHYVPNLPSGHPVQTPASCAKERQSGGWFTNCGDNNLNGVWGVKDTHGNFWWPLDNAYVPVTFSEMKVRIKDNSSST